MTDSISGPAPKLFIPAANPARTARIPLPAGSVNRATASPAPTSETAATVAPQTPASAVSTPGSAPPASIEENPTPVFGFAPPNLPENEASPDPGNAADQSDSADPPAASSKEEAPEPTRPGGLTDQEFRELQELKIQDRQVRQHEQAHIAAGGRYVTGGPTYRFVTGPDGRQYAVAGEVSIDTSKEPTPEQTLIKAQVIRRAALAPSEPSSQDRSVAAQATRLEAEARREILEARIEEIGEKQSAEDNPVRAVPQDFEFTRIGPKEEEDPPETRPRPPITAIPVPLPPEARADIGQLIDFRG